MKTKAERIPWGPVFRKLAKDIEALAQEVCERNCVPYFKYYEVMNTVPRSTYLKNLYALAEEFLREHPKETCSADQSYQSIIFDIVQDLKKLPITRRKKKTDDADDDDAGGIIRQSPPFSTDDTDDNNGSQGAGLSL